MAGVPSAAALVRDDEGRQLLEIAERIRSLARFFVAPPETTAVVLARLRQAFAEATADEEFLRAAAGAGLDIDPLSPDEIDARVRAVFEQPPAVREQIRTLLARTQLP